MRRLLIVTLLTMMAACAWVPSYAQGAPDPLSDARVTWEPSLGATGYKVGVNGGPLIDSGNTTSHTFYSLSRTCGTSLVLVYAYNLGGESDPSSITFTARPRIDEVNASPQNPSICVVDGSSFADDVTLEINGAGVGGLSRDTCETLSFPCANAPGAGEWVSFNVCNGTVCSDTTPKPGAPVIVGVD